MHAVSSITLFLGAKLMLINVGVYSDLHWGKRLRGESLFELNLFSTLSFNKMLVVSMQWLLQKYDIAAH